VDRENFIEEQMLRKKIRKAIDIILEKKDSNKNKQLQKEKELRKVIRKLIAEAEKTEASPHQSTGINVLEDLLKKIIPVVEQDYKQLTTDPGQRESFRAHIINAVQNSLAPEKAFADAGSDNIEELSEAFGRKKRGRLPGEKTAAMRQQDDTMDIILDRSGLTHLVIKRSVKPYDTFVIAKNKDGSYNIFMDPDELKLMQKNVDRSDVLNLSKNMKHQWWEMYSDAKLSEPRKKSDAEREKEFGGRRRGKERRKEKRPYTSPGFNPEESGAFPVDAFTESKKINEVDIDVGGRPEDNDAFIDIEDKPQETPEEDPRDNFGIEGEEVTGRNFAFATFQKVENQIVDSYSLLDNAVDRNLFFDYLITNLKLYFDKFEDQLRANIEEPTTPEYEREKGQQLQPEI
jgi:hypothetical protein